MSQPKEAPDSAQNSNRRLRRVLAVFVGLGLGLASVVWMVRDTTPTLTAAELDRAIDAWQQNGPQSYQLNLKVEGGQDGAVSLTVRDGEVVEMTYNGQQPRSASARQVWTVPGMFDMLDRELEMASEQTTGRPVLRAEFRTSDGVPMHYKRLSLGSAPLVRWQVTHFEPLGPDRP